MKKLRVGLIHCDTHGAYYGPLMAAHDPLRLRDPLGHSGIKPRHSWQTGAGHYYFYTHYCDSTQITVPTLHDFEIARIWDEDREVAEVFASIFRKRPRICAAYEEASDDVDLVFIAECNGDGSDHWRLARPGLEKGVPTFIDKPFAYTVKDALALARLARKRRAPLYSTSMLRTTPETIRFRHRLAEIAPVEFGEVKGFGPTLAGQIHSISLALEVFGTGVAAVECMGRTQLGHILLDYGGQPGRPSAGVMLNCDSGGAWHCHFHVNAYSGRGAIHSPGIGDFEFPWGAVEILKRVRAMCRTGRPPAPYAEMVEGIAVAEAARRAQLRRRSVAIREVWNGNA